MAHDLLVLGAGYAGLSAAKRLVRQDRASEVKFALVSAFAEFVERFRLHQLAIGRGIRADGTREEIWTTRRSNPARFVLLGPIEAWHGVERLQLGRRRERALLAVLLLETNRVVSVDRVMDLLWDGSPPSSARASLRSHVSRLRACLDPAGRGQHGVRLNARGGGYLLDREHPADNRHQQRS
jgi:DNA-binding response OmpR family regulator